MNSYRVELNGEPAGIDGLRALALTHYGHFTSMQVRAGCVRGLDLHLQRLDHATRELFGCPLEPGRTRDWMRQVALDAGEECSLRVSVCALALDRERMAAPVVPDVLVVGSAARASAQSPPRLLSVVHERTLPQIKHLGMFDAFHYRREAQRRGFDDALFVNAHGALCEGTFWNVGFFDGEEFIWPDARALEGTAMQLLRHGMRVRGIKSSTRRIALADVAGFRGAFLCNASRVAPIASIDAIAFAHDSLMHDRLETCMAVNPWQQI